MKKVKLTASNIRTLILPADKSKSEEIFWDTDVVGFGLRVRSTGARSLIFQYGRRGPSNKTPRIKIGSVGAIDFGEARKIAKNYHARVCMGEDPQHDRAEEQKKAGETFAAIASRFLAYQRLRLRPRPYVDVERHILVHAAPLHRLRLAKIERRDIATVIAAVAENSGAVTSNRVRSSLNGLFGWAMREGLIDTNPAINTNKQVERPRDRVLTRQELRLVWTHAGDDHFGAILRLVALTGARPGEIAGLRWSEVRDGEIVLPPSRVKNNRTHAIPLSQAARAILEAQPRRINADGKPRDLIFGYADGAWNAWHNAKKRVDVRIAEATGAPLPPWTPHDLRRSFATHANEIGIEPHIVEACLGHIPGFRAGVAGTYNWATYQIPKRAALARWADQLLAWVKGQQSKVVTLRQA